MDKNLKKFISGSFTAYLNMFATIFISIFSVPLMLHSLGKSSYGLWITVSSIFGFMSISDLGIGQSASKLISEKQGNDKVDDFIDKELVSTTFFANLFIGSIVLGVNLVISLFIYKILHLGVEQRFTIASVYILLAINFFIGFIFSTFKNVLLGYKYISVINLINLFRNIINFISLVVLFKFTTSLHAVAFLQVALALVSGISSVYIISKLNIRVFIRFKYFSIKTFKKICMPGVYYLILTISALLANNTDNLILNYFLSASVVAIYSTGFKMINIFLQMVFTIVDNLFPFISELHGKKDMKRIKKLFLFCERYSIYIGVIIMFIIIIFGKSIMQIWIGKDNYLGYSSMLLFSIFLLLNIINHGPIVFLQSMYEHSNIAKLALGEALLNVALSIFFVRIFGAMGVILGTVLADVFLMFWFATFKTIRTLGIKFGQFIGALMPAIKLASILTIITIALHIFSIEISTVKYIFAAEFILFVILVTIISLLNGMVSIKDIKEKSAKFLVNKGGNVR